MRITFLLLVLINLLAFMWEAGYLGVRESGREPERLSSQLKPEALRLVAPTPPMACQALSDLDEVQLAQLRTLFSGSKDVDLDTRETALPGSYWVAIAALESREIGVRKQAELVKLSITDSQLVEDARHGPFVVVLGSFTELAPAQALLDGLPARNVRSARLITRVAPGNRYLVRLTWPEADAAVHRASLQTWLATLSAGQAIKNEACPAA